MSNFKTAPTVLLVEDDEFVSKAYSYFLEEAGYNVVAVFDGVSAISALQKSKVKPDLVLLDLLMPGMNGFEVLEKIKSDSNLKKVPVIVVSNLSQESDMKECKRLGAEDYLVKSNFTMRDVLKRIEGYVGVPPAPPSVSSKIR